jgi:hypothetical protein
MGARSEKLTKWETIRAAFAKDMRGWRNPAGERIATRIRNYRTPLSKTTTTLTNFLKGTVTINGGANG